jgi:hypothetical protein
MPDDPDGARDRLSLSGAYRVDAVCLRFEDAWKAGQSPRVEDFLGQARAGEGRALLFQLLLLEVEYRRKRGERPGVEEYRSRFAEQSDLVRRIFLPAADQNTQAYQPEEGLPQPFPGEYHIRGLLGEGGFGRVWLADDLNLGVKVALKGVRLRGGVEQRSRALAALQNEARILARLKHPNILQVRGWRQAGDEHFLVLPHNATLQEKGLEMMTEGRLAALVPVDTYIAHEKKHWARMPFDPLMAALREYTRGRLIVADQPVADLPRGTFPPGQAVDSAQTIRVAGPGDVTVERPLFVDYFVPKS